MFGDAYIDDVLVPNPYLMSENQFKLVMVEIYLEARWFMLVKLLV